MSAAAISFDLALDRLLASRNEPAVPADLARRIVVRTANLPQFGAVAPIETQFPASAVAVRWRDRRRFWVGGALAASLAVAMVGSGLSMPSATQSTGGKSANGFVPARVAIEDGAKPLPQGVSTVLPEALARPAAPGKATHEIANPASKPAQAIYLAAADGGLQKPPVASTVEIQTGATSGTQAATPPADSGARLARSGGQIDEFSLASSEEASPRVYGPVLDPEFSRGRAAMSASGSSGAGPALGFASTAPTGGASDFRGSFRGP